MQLVEAREEIVLEGGPGALTSNSHPLAGGFETRPDVRGAVHLHEAIGAAPGHAEEPSRAMILEAPAERSETRRVECRCDGLSLVRLDGLPLEGERDRVFAIDSLSWMRWQPLIHVGCSAGRKTWRTSLVRASRTATNQARQPRRWYHHSRCAPASLARK